MGGFAVLDKCTVRDLGSQTLDLPEDGFVPSLDLLCLLGGRCQVRRARHIQDGLEELKPRIEHILLHQKWRHLKLITNIKHFADQMQHVECILFLHMAHHSVNQQPYFFKCLLHDIVEGLSLLVELEFVS